MLLGALAAATAFGLWRRLGDGRVRPARPSPAVAADAAAAARLGAAELGASLGERATLVQFSSAFCAPCRTARHVLGRVAASVPGVVHVEVDAADRLDLVRAHDVRRTPTTLVLGPDGAVRHRVAGAPRPEAVLAALDDRPGHHR